MPEPDDILSRLRRTDDPLKIEAAEVIERQAKLLGERFSPHQGSAEALEQKAFLRGWNECARQVRTSLAIATAERNSGSEPNID